MNAQGDSWTIIAGTAFAGLLISAIATPALAQSSDYDARWLPWLGCWEATASPTEANAPMLCLRTATEGEGIEMLTVADGEIVSSLPIRADGLTRQISREGCEGRESTSFSATGFRVYLSSEFICEGGVERSSTGLMSMVSPYEWMDVRSVTVAGKSAPWVLRYQLAMPEAVEAAGLADIAVDRLMAQQSARMAASAPLTIGDVVDVSSRMEPKAVEAWVVERGDQFDVDAAVLISMVDADVPVSVIDMVVAVSHPDYFVVDQGLEGNAELVEGEYSQRGAYGRWPGRSIYGVGYGRYADPFFYDPYFLSPFYSPYAGYGYNSPYGRGVGFGGRVSGWGFGYSGYPRYRPTVVVVGRREQETEGPFSRAVRGRGYTRGSSSGSSGSDGASAQGRSGGGASAAPAKPGSSSSGSKSSGRKAKRKGGR
jgi:hypothetical protein